MSIHFRDRTPKVKYLKVTVTHENEGLEIARTFFVTGLTWTKYKP